MTTHVVIVGYGHPDYGMADTIDVHYYCSRSCMVRDLRSQLWPSLKTGLLDTAGTLWGEPCTYADGSPTGEYAMAEYGAWPGGDETDYDVYCHNLPCGELLWRGLEHQYEQ